MTLLEWLGIAGIYLLLSFAAYWLGVLSDKWGKRRRP